MFYADFMCMKINGLGLQSKCLSKSQRLKDFTEG